jgi:hypothetical protein
MIPYAGLIWNKYAGMAILFAPIARNANPIG